VKPAGVSVLEFRRLTGFSHASVHRWIANGTLKSVKVNNRRLISFSEVERIRAGK
jgi:predicted site-specific integrase-resolvase